MIVDGVDAPVDVAQNAVLRDGRRLSTREQFIDRTLLQGEAKRLDIAVDAAQVDAVVAQAAESLPEGVTLEQALSMQGLGYLTERYIANKIMRGHWL